FHIILHGRTQTWLLLVRSSRERNGCILIEGWRMLAYKKGFVPRVRGSVKRCSLRGHCKHKFLTEGQSFKGEYRSADHRASRCVRARPGKHIGRFQKGCGIGSYLHRDGFAALSRRAVRG